MASRLSAFCCLILLLFLIVSGEGGSLKLSLGFTNLSPPEVIVLRNHPLLLNCSGHSDDGPLHISWHYQDKEIEDKHFRIFPNGTLYSEKTFLHKKKERRWEGNYTCLLRNKVGTLVSRPIRVILARVSKTFISEPQSLITKEGGHARFSCQIYAVPPAVISWYRDGTELPQNSSRYTFLPSGILQISGVVLSDAGNYKCRVNAARQRESAEATLTVDSRVEEFQPPLFLNPVEVVTAVANSSAILECIADGFPMVELSWRREDGKPVTEHLLGNGNLYFPKVQPNDAGSYICTANVNKDKNQKAAIQKLSLNVHVPPKFTKVPASQVIPTAQTVRFDCAAEGVPAVSLHWLKNGEQIYIDGRIKVKLVNGNTLIISQTVTSDSGIYQCVASNSAGVNMASARLQVNASSDQPQPPSNVQAITATSSSILLSWDAVSSLPVAPIQAYTVHYVQTLGGSEQDLVSANTSVLIKSLKPYTNYSFYVRAYSNRSASEPSKSIVQMTGEDVPLVAPKIMLSSISPTTLHVQWDALSLEKSRGIITEHRIYYRKHKQASSSVRSSNIATEYTITGLTPKQKYDVRVLSGTKAGFPILSDEAWPWQTYEMPPASNSKVPFPPTLHLTVINNTALEVEWSMPSDNPYPVTGFYLSYRQQNKPMKQRISLLANATTFLLNDLVPQSWYEVYLVAFNKKGESGESVRNIITFSGDNPNIETVEVVEPPHQLEAEPLSSSTIRLTWKTPETSRNISYYTVRYHPVFTNGLVNESYIYYIRSTNNDVVIMDLQPFTLYGFSVRSHDVDKRQGPFSPIVECRTNEALPSVPQDLTWSPIDANSIRLNWQPPKFTNGIITAYYILYSTKNDNKLSWKIKEEKGTELTSLLTGLTSNTLYYFRMRAKNAAGLSPPTHAERINIPVRQNNTKPPSPESIEAEPTDPLLGIIIGAGIGLVCLITCAGIICRNRCYSANPDPASEGRSSTCCGNGYIPHLNGHILGNSPPSANRESNIEVQEMESFTPLNSYPNGSNERHLDTKGGYPTKLCNGRANGMPPQISRNSHAPVLSNQGTQPTSQDAPAPTKQLMRYSPSDRKISENGWGDEPGDITSTTVLLDGELSSNPAAADCNNGTPKLPKSDIPPSSTTGANNKNAESSCNTESKDSFNKLISKTHSHCTVPPTSSSSIHQSPSDCCLSPAEIDQNSVPSIESARGSGGSRGKAGIASKRGGEAGSDEQSSLPFSVNAFLSPLAGPRFSQSSNSNSSTEPT